MSDLADFLLARIAEDEAAVRSLAEYGGSTGYPGRCREHPGADGWDWIPTSEWDDGYRLATTSARVLAECEAKRRIVETVRHARERYDQERDSGYGDGADMEWLTKVEALEPILSMLALPYGDHPDWREEWRP